MSAAFTQTRPITPLATIQPSIALTRAECLITIANASHKSLAR